MTTERQLLQVYKRLITNRNSGTDVHYNNTQATGYCQPAMLEQLYRRHRTGGNMNNKLDLRIHRDRVQLKAFIKTLIKSIHPDSPDVLRYQNVIIQLNANQPSLDRSLWMGLECINEYQFAFPVTGWVHNQQDTNYVSLAYTNRLGPEHQYPGIHTISCADIRTISNCTNDFHHSKDHFYIVPSTNEEWSTIQDRLRSAFTMMIPHIREHLSQYVTEIIRQYPLRNNIQHTSAATNTSDSNPQSSPIIRIPHHVTLGDDWARIMLNEYTIQNLPAEVLQLALSDPQLFLRTCNIMLFQVQFNTMYGRTGQPSNYTSIVNNNNNTATNYTDLVSKLHNQCTSTEMSQAADKYLLESIDLLTTILLKLIPQLTTNYIPGVHHFSTQLTKVKGQSTNNTITLSVSKDIFQLFTGATSRENIQNILLYQSTPIISLFKVSNNQLRPYINSDSSHSCYKTLILSQERAQFIQNKSTITLPGYLRTSTQKSQDHVKYVEWLKTQYEQSLFGDNIKRRLPRAIDRAHIVLRTCDIPDLDELVQLNIDWRTTIWRTNEDPEAHLTYPAWSNRLSQHYRLPQPQQDEPVFNNLFNYQQILTLLKGDNDIESSGKYYYPLPSNTDDKALLHELTSALRNLAGNLYDILTSIYNPPRIILPLITVLNTIQPTNDGPFQLREQLWYTKPNCSPKLVIIEAIHKDVYPHCYTVKSTDTSNEIQTIADRLTRARPFVISDQLAGADSPDITTSCPQSSKMQSQSLITNAMISKQVYDTTTLRQMSKLFTTETSRSILIRELNVGIALTPTIYPSILLRNELEYLLERTEVRHATHCDGMGLFTTPPIIREGEVVIIYGGKPIINNIRNSYTMQITNSYEVGHPPIDTDRWTKAGYINDYIWNRKWCNCKMLSNGIIVATKDIRSGSELFMSYGQHYDWSAVKLSYHIQLVEYIITMSTKFPSGIMVPSFLNFPLGINPIILLCLKNTYSYTFRTIPLVHLQ